MCPAIAILEDDPDRVGEMTGCLRELDRQCDVVTFDNAPDMIAWLAEHLSEVALICLDHDLGPNRRRGGQVFDPGTGRDVADYLATRVPVCPVIVHTSNSLAAPGMEMVLGDAGWKHSRIVPYGGLEWVRSGWASLVVELLERNW